MSRRDLSEALKWLPAGTRWDLVQTFRTLHWLPSVEILEVLTKDQSEEVRLGAIDALGVVGGKRARSALFELLEELKGQECDWVVVNALNQPRSRKPVDVELLCKVATSSEFTDEARATAVEGLIDRLDESSPAATLQKARETVKPLTESTNPRLAQRATKFLE